MASPLNPLHRDPSDYDVNYLNKIKAQKDTFVKTIDPKDMHKFLPMLSAFSRYHESGMIMLHYKKMPDQKEHLKQTKINNRVHAIEFNEELSKIGDDLSNLQMILCNDLCLTMLHGR